MCSGGLQGDDQHSVRLNNAWDVYAYNLSVSVELASWTFSTKEVISLRRKAAAPATGTSLDTLTLHGNTDLAIDSVAGAFVQSRAVKDRIHFSLPKEALDSNEWTITVAFNGIISEELRGFYRVTYDDPSGKQCRMASTHFEPVGARKFFFCVDEPAARANFSIAVSLPATDAHYTVLSNGPLQNTSKDAESGATLFTFQEVPHIPPYLCALVIGELEFTETIVNQRIPLRIYTTKGKQPRAQFALEAAAFSLDYFEKFFDAPYPLPKLDLVTVPDFPIGGMENWGCICLVESCLIDPATSSLKSKKVVSDLVCHEVSHNWFGNLVGIDWWEGLWLKEGFASWCGYYGTSIWKPDWNAMDDAVSEVMSALEVDAHQGTHPVEVPITDPSYITQVFDSISYSKGMAVVLMLQSFLGFEGFRDGIRVYIQRYKYANTRTNELWAVLEEVSKKPVQAVMSSFTSQGGHPLVSASATTAVGDDGEKGHVTFAQRRYAFAASSAAPTANDTWVVPLTARWGQDSSVDSISLEQREVTVPRKESLVKLNPLHFGFYRCAYSAELFREVLRVFDQLPYQDRRGFVSDTFATFHALPSTASFSDVLSLISEVTEHETNPAVLNVLYEEVHRLADIFEVSSKESASMLLEAALGSALRDASGWTERPIADLTPTEAQQRSQCIGQALQLLRHRGDKESPLIQWALASADQYLAPNGGGSKDPDVLLDVLVCAAIVGPLACTREAMEKKLEAIKDNASEARILLRAICMLPDVDFVEKVLTTCAAGTSNTIRSQYGAIVYLGACANPLMTEGGGRMWAYFQQHYDAVMKQWGEGQFRIQAIVEAVGSTLRSSADADGFDSFFVEHPIPNAALSCVRAAEGIRQRAHLNQKFGALVEAALRKQK
ncbi:aminopeptidase, putative [Bodo saltans]|uniref:Aminopeptidase n=1 Tax=Bodo saltans TaxID=75058 RepID=A0A0S4IPD6_BODSA|nr:aminopeptidase, putative [Bodo saltans]|eukprot:CUF06443.1 aminopeptidase, putative [Bodo saltans]